MIIDSLAFDPVELERRTGWAIKPERACKGDICVPPPRIRGSNERSRGTHR